MSNTMEAIEKPYYKTALSMVKKDPHNGSALDIGCGRNPLFFHGKLSNYVGIDIDINTLRKVSISLPQASLIRASGFQTPHGDGAFGLVICTEVLEHVKNPGLMIAEISRLLMRGGTAVVSIPSLSLPQIIILWIARKAKRISDKPYQSPDHRVEYARFKVSPHFEYTTSLFELFRQRNLEVQDIATVQSLYAKQRILNNILVSKIERAFGKIFSKCLIGHYTIFRAKKK